MSSIPFYLVTGFLGSGKTTLLKRILNEYDDQKRIAIIQNEFAAGNIDGKELKQSDKPFEILEINKGSVFCVCLLSDFIQSLNIFVEKYQPEIVILEASGLSDPIAIAQLLQSEKLIFDVHLAYIWCVVDAANYLKISKMATRAVHQIRIAYKVILNKIDIAKDVDVTIDKVKEINPFAQITKTSYCKIPVDLLNTDMAIGAQPPEGFSADRVAIKQINENAKFESCGSPDIDSAVIKTNKAISKNQLNSFLKKIEHDSIRIKGVVKLENNEMVLVQSCFGETKFFPIDKYIGPTELIVIGSDIEDGLEEMFLGTI